MNGFWQQIYQHATAYGLGSGVLVLAAIQCMPKPGTPWTWGAVYTWIYETLQTVLPVNRSARPNTIAQPVPAAPAVAHEPITADPSQPADPAQPKQ